MARDGQEKAVESKTYNEIMKEAMKGRGVKQVDLADRMGVLQSTISGHLNRKRIGLEVFTAIMNAMEYDVVVVDRKTGKPVWTVEEK